MVVPKRGRKKGGLRERRDQQRVREISAGQTPTPERAYTKSGNRAVAVPSNSSTNRRSLKRVLHHLPAHQHAFGASFGSSRTHQSTTFPPSPGLRTHGTLAALPFSMNAQGKLIAEKMRPVIRNAQGIP